MVLSRSGPMKPRTRSHDRRCCGVKARKMVRARSWSAASRRCLQRFRCAGATITLLLPKPNLTVRALTVKISGIDVPDGILFASACRGIGRLDRLAVSASRRAVPRPCADPSKRVCGPATALPANRRESARASALTQVARGCRRRLRGHGIRVRNRAGDRQRHRSPALPADRCPWSRTLSADPARRSTGS